MIASVTLTTRDPVTEEAILSDHLVASHLASTTMTVTLEELEEAIRAKIQATHVEVEDNSGGCGEKYSVLIVSKVL